MSGVYQAEYIWIDGTKPTAKLRAKGKTVPVGQAPPIWGFDGSSTGQAPGDKSDCVLKPVFICPDPVHNRPQTADPTPPRPTRRRRHRLCQHRPWKKNTT